MAELRARSVVLLLLVVGLVAVVGLVFAGMMTIPAMDFGLFKTPEFSKKSANEGLDSVLATTGGYTPAKTPNEAMDKFREAIQARKYKFAARYVSKNYAEFLERGHTAGSELGAEIDKIRSFGKEKGIMTDKLTLVLYRLDAFPTNFKVGPAPTVDDKTGIATGTYIWEAVPLKNLGFQLQWDHDIDKFDKKMFQNALAGPIVGTPGTVTKIKLIKDGEAWKLDIPTNEGWNLAVNHYIDRYKTYHTGLSTFVTNMSNERYSTPTEFEREILGKLRDANP